MTPVCTVKAAWDRLNETYFGSISDLFSSLILCLFEKTLPYPSNSMLHCSWKAHDYTELVEVPAFSEPKGSLPYSQMPVIDPYLEQVWSISPVHIPFM